MITVRNDDGTSSVVRPALQQDFGREGDADVGREISARVGPSGPLVTHELAFRLWYKNVLSRLKWCGVRDSCLEDVAQETFMTARSCWDGCSDESKRKAWLLGLTKNTARNHVRSCRFGCKRSRTVSGDVEVDGLSCPSSAKSETEVRDIFEKLLALAVDVLSAKEHEVFILHWVMDLTAKEVGYLTGVSEKGVYEIANAAKRKLMASWKKRHSGDLLGGLMLLEEFRGWHIEDLETGETSASQARGKPATPGAKEGALDRVYEVSRVSGTHGKAGQRVGVRTGWQAALGASLGVGIAVVALLMGSGFVSPTLGSSEQSELIDVPNYVSTMNVYSEGLGSGRAEMWQARSVRHQGRCNADGAFATASQARAVPGVAVAPNSSIAPLEAEGATGATDVRVSPRSASDVELDRRRLAQVDKALRAGRPGDALALLSGFTPRVLVGHTRALEGIAKCAAGQTKAGRDTARPWLGRLENQGLEQRLRNSCDLADTRPSGLPVARLGLRNVSRPAE